MASLEPPGVNMGPPRKRQRILSPSLTNSTTSTQMSLEGTAAKSCGHNRTVMSDTGFQPDREAQVGIIHFVNSANVGFTGTLKQRYTDFLVNEIAPDGTVVHLTDDKAPNQNAVAKFIQTNSGGGSKADESGEENTQGVKQKFTQEFEGAVKQEIEQECKQDVKQEAESDKNSTPVFVITPEDDELLVKYFGDNLKNDIIEMHTKILGKPTAKPAVFGALFTEPITDRPLRGRLHQDVRRIFLSRLETEVIDDTGVIRITAAPPVKAHPEGRQRNQNPHQRNQPDQPRGQLGWQELGGQYLHFSLYKENKDTMEVISFLARCLKCKPKDFQFAGTKDRRAATVQRVSVYRRRAPELARWNSQLRNARIGNFKYEKQSLELGENDGNQFIITLRDCHFAGEAGLDHAARVALANEVVGKAVKHLQDHGFINYFGLQRFGTFGIGTDEVGKKILTGDFQGAVDAILSYSEESLNAAINQDSSRSYDKISRDDLDRAHAIYLFKHSANGNAALDKMPNKFSGEKAIIRHLSSKQQGSDYIGALLGISRNLRTMYVHAYQSLVWNTVASERWARYGDKVIKGDLVIMDTQANKAVGSHDEVDESGEVVVRPAVDDFAVTHDDIYQRARPLTSEEAESGRYSIFDIVLPTPGFDVDYPANDIGDFYKEFMGSDRGGNIDPADMRRKQKDFSLSGNYRKLIGQVGKGLSFEIKTYVEENEQLVETDLEKLDKSRPNFSRERQNNGARGQNNGRSKDWAQNDHSGRNGREGRHTTNFDNQRYERRPNHDMEQQSPPRGKFGIEVDPKLSAWLNLPEKLIAEDKANAKAAELARLNAEPVDLDDIKQPIYKETFIETSLNEEGRRTGHRSTRYIGADGKEMDKEHAESKSLTDFDAMELSTKQAKSDSASIDSPKKRPADKISTSASPRLDPAASEFVTPARLEKVVKIEQLVDFDGERVLGPQLNPTNSDFISTIKVENAADEESQVEYANKLVSTPSLNLPGSDPVASTAKADKSVSSLDSAGQQNIQVPDVKIAVIIKFILGTSQYATVALRELMKLGGVKTYKPDFSGGR